MGADNTNQDVTAEQAQETPAAEVPQTITLEEFLADESNRAAYEAAVTEGVAAAVEKKQAEEAEAKRLEGLSQEEKVAEKEKELLAREAKLQMAELKSAAILSLGNEGIPAQLADCFNYSSMEDYEKSRDAVTAAFKEAVQLAVNERLRGKTIPAAVDGKKTVEDGNVASDLKALIEENQAKR